MKNILVADDEVATRELISQTLRGAGFSVTTVADGAAALEEVGRKKFDLLLLDVWMPHATGLEVMARLREKPSPPKVIIMTGDDTRETLLEAVREQAYRYVAKPIQMKALVELVEGALADRPASPPIEVISARPDWVELLVPCSLEAAERIENFMTHLKSDLSDEVRESVGEAFHELLLNAVEWGGQLDPNRKVRISYLRARKMLLYRIADPGPGFRFADLSHAAVAYSGDQPTEHDKIRQKKGLRPGGFGILLTQSRVDELLYNEAQNEVVFVKYLDS